jgi:hypothetical protein
MVNNWRVKKMTKLDKRLQSIIGFFAARDYVQANLCKRTGKMYKNHRPYNLSSDVVEALAIVDDTEAEKKAFWLTIMRRYPDVDFDNEEKNWVIKYWRRKWRDKE